MNISHSNPERILKAAQRDNRWIIGIILLLGTVRVFIFNMAFPPFNHVDEAGHFDLVLCYSKGQIPDKGLQTFQEETADIFLLYDTPEYLNPPERFKGGLYPPPPGTVAKIKLTAWYSSQIEQVRHYVNFETGSFPVYYAAAGVWTALGRLLGVDGVNLVFWIRFLNVPFFAILIWLSYKIAGLWFPDSPYFRIGLPLAVALFPQDLFFTINNDAFSPWLFTLAIYLFSQMEEREPSVGRYILTGLVVAATFLVKLSNLAILVLPAILAVRKIYSVQRGNQMRSAWSSFVPMFLATGVPITAWLVRCRLVLGDWVGSADKIWHFGWTLKPLSEILNHPIFTADGASIFYQGLTRTFWRGELFWHGQKIYAPWMDNLYLISTGILLGISMVAMFLSKKRGYCLPRKPFVLSWILVGISVLLLVLFSLRFDFGPCKYPSRQAPYFTSGRLIFGNFIPFVLLYMNGLRCLFGKYKTTKWPLVALAILMLVIAAGEWMLNAPVIHSEYNWFHLP